MGSEQRWWRVRGGSIGEGYYAGDTQSIAPIIGNTQQIYINLFACIFCGSYFGIMFSVLGLEDNETDHMLIHKERLYTFPMGIMCGAIVGAANSHVCHSGSDI